MNNKYLKFKNILPPLPNPNFEPIINLISNREATVEGCIGILEYNDAFVSINCRNFVLNFNGFDFSIKSNPDSSITVTGNISDIGFSIL